MKLQRAIEEYLETKEDLKGYPTYKSALGAVEINPSLKGLNLAGDLRNSQRTERVVKTRKIFQEIETSLKDKSQNTKYYIINMVKFVFKYLEDNYGYILWKNYKIAQDKKDIVVLEPEFAKAFIMDSHNIYDGLKDNLKAVHELSSVMLTSSLRFIDALNIKSENLQGGKVVIKNQKTGIVTSCPLPEGLYIKLEQNLTKSGYPYSKEMSSDMYYELFEKLFCQYPELKKLVNGEPFYEQIRFHTFRKTAITLMLYMKVPHSVVTMASGHTMGSKAFQRYVGFVEKMHDDYISDFQSKFYS